MTATPSEQTTLLDRLWQSVAEISHDWAVWQRLYVTDDERQIRRLQSLPHFFGMLQSVLADHIMLAMARLLDPKKNFGLSRVLSSWDQPQGSSQLAQARDLIAEYEELCEGIEAHRNKRLAHQSVQHFVNGGQLDKVAIGDIETGSRLLVAILNEFERYAGRPLSDFQQWAPPSPAGQILACIEQYETWRNLRQKCYSMTAAEIALVVKRGELPQVDSHMVQSDRNDS